MFWFWRCILFFEFFRLHFIHIFSYKCFCKGLMVAVVSLVNFQPALSAAVVTPEKENELSRTYV